MKAFAAVLEAFNAPLAWREFEVLPPAPGGLTVKIEAAGICGSDLHMWEGKDPRTPLPIILGHEAVGRVLASGGEKRDITGRIVREGDLIAWDRGVTCGECHYCVVRKAPYLCPNRRVYGINMSCAEPPFLLGGYAEVIQLLPRTNVLIVPSEIDPALLVAASCSGATAAHAVESCDIHPGDEVIVQGPGPLGLFVLAFALERGATQAAISGSQRNGWKLETARRFGATAILDGQTSEERLQQVRALTDGRGAQAVIECSGSMAAHQEGLKWVAPGGAYAWAGAAVPIGELSVGVYEDVVRKNVRIQGVWVSDTSHFYQAAQLVLGGRYPFAEMVTHRFPLSQADQALRSLQQRETLKAVLVP
jgi:threonine dehydrogenase-like Zn-dependent dehydrogenase